MDTYLLISHSFNRLRIKSIEGSSLYPFGLFYIDRPVSARQQTLIFLVWDERVKTLLVEEMRPIDKIGDLQSNFDTIRYANKQRH